MFCEGIRHKFHWGGKKEGRGKRGYVEKPKLRCLFTKFPLL